MLLITHPDNVKKIQSVCKSGESYASYAKPGSAGCTPIVDWMHLFHSGYKLIECTFMPPTRPSGMYSINGSGRFKPEEISLKTAFITYGPEDLDYLIYAGVAEEIREMSILCIHESQFASANQAMRCTPAQFDFFRKPVEPMMMSGGSGGVLEGSSQKRCD